MDGDQRARHVLVIDDESAIRELIRIGLESAGFTVDVAPEGAGGLASMAVSPADVVLCDIFMPGKEGLETIAELRRAHPDCKILAISGGGRIGHFGALKVAKSLGADAVIMKPF